MAKRKITGHIFTVQPLNHYTRFPFDMLRYDRCWPAKASDSTLLRDTKYRTGVVQLRSCLETPPTYGRWRSFGWEVVNSEPVYS